MIQQDISIINKLVKLISRPIFSNMKIQPSQFFSEKLMTSQQIKRLVCLCKIYLFVFERNNSDQLRSKLTEVSNPYFLKFLV